MISDEQIRAYILMKLVRKGKWGGAHTSFDNVKKWIHEKDLGKQGMRRVKNVARDLIRDGLVISKPTHYGLEISLNPKKSFEIDKIIKKFYPREEV